MKSINVKDTDQITPENCEAVVCMPVGPSPWHDNLTGECAECGRAIMFRPHGVPENVRKICLPCLMGTLEELGQTLADVDALVTREQLPEIGEYMEKRK